MSNEPSLRLELEQTTPADDADERAPSSKEGSAVERFVAQHGADLRYCEAWGRWLFWTGKRWTLDRHEPLWRAMQALSAVGAHGTHSTEAGAASVLRLARHAPGVAIVPEELNRDATLFNCANGTLDLRLGELRPYRRDDHITRLSPVVWDRAATAPRWETFIAEITGGDTELAAFVQRIAGYLASGMMTEDALFFLLGPTASGKSTFVRVLLDLLGDYGTPAELEHLPSAHRVAAGIDPVQLLGRRVFACGEFDTARPIPSQTLERVTSAAPFLLGKARPWTYVPTQKFVLASNVPPRFTGNDAVVARRLHIVRLASVPAASRDRELFEKLRAERSGILRWAAIGFARWEESGLRPPLGVASATSRQRGEAEATADVGEFLKACCELAPDASTLAGDLFRAYRDWCAVRGAVAPGWRVFGAGLRASNLKPARGNKGVRWWRGVRLKAQP